MSARKPAKLVDSAFWGLAFYFLDRREGEPAQDYECDVRALSELLQTACEDFARERDERLERQHPPFG